MPLSLRHSASETAKHDHCACARMRDMRLDESWTGSNLGPPQRQGLAQAKRSYFACHNNTIITQSGPQDNNI